MPRFFGYLTPPANRPLESLDAGQVAVLLRRWDVSTMDWAKIQVDHRLSPGFQIADAWTEGVGSQLVVEADDLPAAAQRLRRLRSLLRVAGVYPAWIPIFSTHSIDDFSAIAEPSVPVGDARAERHAAVRDKREHVSVEILDLGLSAAPTDSESFTQAVLDQVAAWEPIWDRLIAQHAEVRVLDEALRAAPEVHPLSQVVLHVWSTLENIFPTVQAEVAYRVSLYLAQLIDASARRATYDAVRRGYRDRSKIAHGAALTGEQTQTAWNEAWLLLRDVSKAILHRAKLPSEEDLLTELIG